MALELFLLVFVLLLGAGAVGLSIWIYFRMNREDTPPPDSDDGEGGVPPGGDSLPRTDLPPTHGIDLRVGDEWRESVSS